VERTLFSALSLVTAILAFSTWVHPGAIEDIVKLVGANVAHADGDIPNPKTDPFRQLPDVRMPTAPTSPARPAEWPGNAPDYAAKYNLPANANLLAQTGSPTGPVSSWAPPASAGQTTTSPSVPSTPSGFARPWTPTVTAPGTSSANPSNPPAVGTVSLPPPSTSTQPLTTAPFPTTPLPTTSPAIPTTTKPMLVDPQSTPNQASGAPIEAAQILARVGSQVILAADAMPMVNEIINPQKDKIPPGEMDKVKMMLMQKYVIGQIETKLLYAEAMRNLPTANVPTIEKNLASEFEKSRLPDMIKKAGLTSYAELDDKLRQVGSSVEKQKKGWTEQAIAYSYMQQQLKAEEEVRREDMLEYYLAHRADYETPPQAKFEQITARFDRFSTKEEAFRAVAEWGNLVLKGQPFADVAKTKSQSFNAASGGLNDWTSQGSLRSEAIDRALFSLPVGRMSQILEDEDGFHIVRVVDRHPLLRKPFEDVQPEIKKKIKQDRSEKQRKDYLAKLRERTPVWTIWDEPAAGNNSGDANIASPGPSGFQR